MATARILIVDDEESLLKVLSDSLKGLKNEYEIITATNGLEALEHLKQAPCELVVTDYRMGEMDGLELLEAIRSIRPKTRVILMTAYGTDELEAESRRLQAYQYLTKPLKLNAFRQVVEDALCDLAISQPGILILSDERYRQVIAKLEELQANVGARSIFLANLAGQVIAYAGDEEKSDLEQIASLVGGGMATLIESGRFFDDGDDSINLAYREGKEDCLYAVNIGEQLILVLLLHNGPYASRIGSVWFYAQRAARDLHATFEEYEAANPQQVFAEGMGEELQEELDDLFSDQSSSEKNGGDSGGGGGDDAGTLEPEITPNTVQGSASTTNGHVMSFEEAMENGIISVEAFEDGPPAEGE